MSAANVEVIKALIREPGTDVVRMLGDLQDPDFERAVLAEVDSLFDPEFETVGH